MQIVSKNLQRLLRDWEQRRHRRFPRRADFDPSDLRYILGAISIFEVHREPLRFRARLYGTRMANRLGFDLTGKFVDESPNRQWASVASECLERAVTEEACLLVRHVNRIIDYRVFNVERLILPVSAGDGHALDMILTAFDESQSTDRDAPAVTEIVALPGTPETAMRAPVQFSDT